MSLVIPLITLIGFTQQWNKRAQVFIQTSVVFQVLVKHIGSTMGSSGSALNSGKSRSSMGTPDNKYVYAACRVNRTVSVSRYSCDRRSISKDNSNVSETKRKSKSDLPRLFIYSPPCSKRERNITKSNPHLKQATNCRDCSLSPDTPCAAQKRLVDSAHINRSANCFLQYYCGKFNLWFC